MAIIGSLAEFTQAFKEETRLLGLDVGSKRVGVALSDRLRTIATPFKTIERHSLKRDVQAIVSAMEEQGAGGLVAGLPLTMQGLEEESCKQVRALMEAILKIKDIPVYLQDERLSTSAVHRALKETGFTRKKKQSLDDKMAAAYILQGALDQMRYAYR